MNKEKAHIKNTLQKRIDYLIDKKIICIYPIENENINDTEYSNLQLKNNKYDEKLLFLYNLLDSLNDL